MQQFNADIDRTRSELLLIKQIISGTGERLGIDRLIDVGRTNAVVLSEK